MYPVFSAAWKCTVDEPVLRVVVGGTPYLTRLNLAEDEEAWIAGDGDVGFGNSDLLEQLRFALETWLTGTFSVELDSDCKVVITSSQTLTLAWSHDDTTLDATIFGFDGSDIVVTSGVPFTAPYQSSLIWTPDRWWRRDTGDTPDMVAAHKVTGSGLSRGYRLTSGYQRVIDFDLLPASTVQLDDTSRPYSTLYKAIEAWADGRKIRVYDDVDNMAPGVYRSYRWQPGSMPQQLDTVGVRYAVSLPLRKDTTSRAVTRALNLGTAGFAEYFDWDAYDAAQVFDGASKLTVSCWVNVTTTNDVTLISRLGSIGSYQYEIRFQNAGSGLHAVQMRIARSTSTLTTTSVNMGLANTGWHHLVFVFDGAETGTNKVAMYLDGVDQATSYSGTYDMTALPTVPSLDMRVGSWLTGSFWLYQGDIDDLAIWRNVALSASEVADLYALGQDANIRDVASTRPAVWWRFEESLWADFVASPLEPNTSVARYVEVE